MSKFQTWEELKETLNITPEEEEEIRLEEEIIRATIEARKNKNITQEELSKMSGLKQSTIARVESGRHSPTTSTLMKMLHPMGYTLTVVPSKDRKVTK